MTKCSPCNALLSILGLCLLSLLPATGFGEPLESYRYRQQTEEKVEHFDWLLEKPGNFLLLAVSDTEIHRTVLDDQLRTESWTLDNEKQQTAVKVWREGERLILTGRWHGETIDKELRIDAAPWYQAMSLSLRAFLASPQDSTEFWTLRPDELKPLKLKVSKKALETVQLDARTVAAQRLEVRLTGLGSLLGHSLYWFRPTDGLFLKYQGPNGMPGLATTLITLEQERVCSPADDSLVSTILQRKSGP